jgi:DNA-directed RNA polymerase subunit E'/Rpb7
MATSFQYTPVFRTLTLEHTIRLTPNELNDKDINSVITYYLKRDVGDKCTKEGYVKKDSINILQRTIGKINTRFLDGSINYKVIYSADICCPRVGDIYEATFIEINKSGILAEKVGTPLNIVLPKDLHTDKSLYKQLSSDDNGRSIAIEIMGMKFLQNTRVLSVIGKLVGLP